MTRHHSRSLLSLAVVSIFISIVMNYIFELDLLVVNYIVDLMICGCIAIVCHIAAVCEILYSLSILEAHHLIDEYKGSIFIG
jgi:hypothetical protein